MTKLLNFYKFKILFLSWLLICGQMNNINANEFKLRKSFVIIEKFRNGKCTYEAFLNDLGTRNPKHAKDIKEFIFKNFGDINKIPYPSKVIINDTNLYLSYDTANEFILSYLDNNIMEIAHHSKKIYIENNSTLQNIFYKISTLTTKSNFTLLDIFIPKANAVGQYVAIALFLAVVASPIGYGLGSSDNKTPVTKDIDAFNFAISVCKDQEFSSAQSYIHAIVEPYNKAKIYTDKLQSQCDKSDFDTKEACKLARDVRHYCDIALENSPHIQNGSKSTDEPKVQAYTLENQKIILNSKK